MTFFADLLSTAVFRARSLRSLGERRAVVRGVACFSLGFLAFVMMRNSVYQPLRESLSPEPDVIDSFFHLNLIQAILFLLLVYIPAVIIMSNSISGGGLGLSISKEEYRANGSALLPLWGLLLLIAAPLQLLAPQFLILGVFGISIGLFALLVLIAVYTVWSIKELNYLSVAQALGVFVLSWFTLPVFYLLAAFIFAIPLFIMIPLLYVGYQWIRGYFSSHVSERAFQQHLHALTSNPQDADAHYQLGLIHLKRRNLDTAQHYFENALKIDRDDPDCHYWLGRAREMKGEWAQALGQYEETYRLNPEYSLGDIFREVGKGYLHTGQVEKAAEFLTYFLKNRGSDPEGRYWLAVALQKTGDTGQMLAQLKIILEQARSNPRFFKKENREWIYRARNMIRDSKFEIKI